MTNRSSRPAIALGTLLVALVAIAIGAYRFHHDRLEWTSDGAIYLRMLLHDRGLSEDEAKRRSDAFINTTPEARLPEAKGFYTDSPPQHYRDQFALFRSRPLYPLLAAPLYPRFGPDALKIVSVCAYVAATVLMYLVLLQLVPAWLAALGAIGFGTAPPVLNFAALPLTDELALALWIAAFGALLAALRGRALPWLPLAIASAAVLTFVRPAIYLPFGAALAAFLASPRGSAQRTTAARAAIAFVAIGLAFLAFTTWVHGPGVAQQLRWEYDWERATGGPFSNRPFIMWWALTFVATLAQEVVVETYRHGALFMLVLAGIGLVAARGTIVAALAIGGAAATLVALIVNPVELQRTVTLPLTPILVLLATLALSAAVARIRERAPAGV
ncbi:MAG TPA: hypothetical protein VGX96_01110 [Candidatus Elarobacter sp.]|jgi:hypothetical protein|nr:hypothetical protein [Candidatus Elarobacter sp.]